MVYSAWNRRVEVSDLEILQQIIFHSDEICGSLGWRQISGQWSARYYVPFQTEEPGKHTNFARLTYVSILENTLKYLQRVAKTSNRSIAGVSLGNYFTFVHLDDDSLGACMSCYRLGPAWRVRVEAGLVRCRETDPLLINLLFKGCRHGTLRSTLQASLLSALSAPIIRAGGDETFQVFTENPYDLLDGVRRVLIVGFGGYLRQVANDSRVEEIHVADFEYDGMQERIDRELQIYRRSYPWKRFTASATIEEFLCRRTADLVCVTGSTLCNNTIDSVLRSVAKCSRVVLQGQSASIHPAILFQRGVNLVVTTVKPSALIKFAQQRPERLRPILEGGLPAVYLTPRHGAGLGNDLRTGKRA